MKLAIEGMDGSGKTTIGREIAKHYDLMYIDKPLHYFFEDSEENGYADLMAVANRVYKIKDSAIRAWFIGMGNILCFRKFENFIVDRHFASNYFWNGDMNSDAVFKSMIDIVGVPDLTILLYATPQTRRQRMMLRDKNDKDLNDPEKFQDGYDKMLYFLQNFSIPYICVNTENKSIEEVLEEIYFEIDKIKGKSIVRK